MSKIIERNGIIAGYNGDITFTEKALAEVFDKASFEIYNDFGQINQDYLKYLANTFHFIPISLYEKDNSYHYLINYETLESLEKINNTLYIIINEAVDTDLARCKKYEKAYEKFKLKWLLDHGCTLAQLIKELDEIYDEDPLKPSECFNLFESDYGFGSEIYPSFDEWFNNDRTTDI